MPNHVKRVITGLRTDDCMQKLECLFVTRVFVFVCDRKKDWEYICAGYCRAIVVVSKQEKER